MIARFVFSVATVGLLSLLDVSVAWTGSSNSRRQYRSTAPGRATLSPLAAPPATTTTTTRSSRRSQLGAVVEVVSDISNNGGSSTLEPLGVILSLGIASSAYFFLNSPETSDDIRTYWDKSVVNSDSDIANTNTNTNTAADADSEQAKKAMSIPSSIPKDTSPEQLTLMVKDVANAAERNSEQQLQLKKDKPVSVVERILPTKISRVFINRRNENTVDNDEDTSGKTFTPQPIIYKSNTRFGIKLLKKIVMPWRKWSNL